MEDKMIHIGGYHLAYETVGRKSSPALIMVHGLMSHMEIWATTMKVFKLNRFCVAMDLLGFGSSPKPNNANYSIQSQAQRIIQLADELELHHFDLMGHSMGSQIALYVAAKLAPERVNRIITIAPVVRGRFNSYIENVIFPAIALGARAPFFYRLMGRLSKNRLFADLIFRPWFHDMSKIPFQYWKVDRDMALQPSIHKSANESIQSMRTLDLTNELPKIKVPTLVISGNQDRTLPVSEGQLIKQYVPNNTIRQIDQCGHFPMYEQRNLYLDYILAFLRQDNL